jgi:hypothetical protein
LQQREQQHHNKDEDNDDDSRCLSLFDSALAPAAAGERRV